jgi:predicted ATP-grasp superfamily ATP-dependent carboligase
LTAGNIQEKNEPDKNRIGCEDRMANFIIVGKSRNVVVAVLQSIRSFSDARCVVIGDFETTALNWSSLCDRQITLTLLPKDDDLFLQHVYELARIMPDAVLIPADCVGIRLANRVRVNLPLPVAPIPHSDTLEAFDDKWRFYELCEKHEMSVPPTRLIGSKHQLDFRAVAADLGVPFVVKPTNQAGSHGVHIVTSEAYYDAVIRNNDDYRFSPLIAQRYIEGVDIDLSLLSIDGELSAFAVQQVIGPEIRFVSNAYLENIARELCRCSGYHGVMHVDARLEKCTGKIFLIESNPRFWVSVTASVWCGLNFVAESIQPSARPNGPLELTTGTAYTRHPIMRPASWRQLISDRGAAGRLLRAMTFDPFSLANLCIDFPALVGRYARKHMSPGIERISNVWSVALKDSRRWP